MFLQDRMCGTEVMKGRDIAGFLHFPPGEPSQAVHKEQLFALFDEWEQGTLSDFLKFTTGLCVLPIGGLKNPEVSWRGRKLFSMLHVDRDLRLFADRYRTT
jgi:hypothetical protein